MRNGTTQLKTRVGIAALICLLPFAIFAADSSSGTSGSSSSSPGDAAGKASDTSKTAAAASGLQCIMMMNMASKMDDKDLKTMTMMMALQQCAQSTSFSKASQENDNIKNSCSKYESREVDGKWVVDAVCTARGRTITKHVVTSLSGDSFHEENTAPQGTMTTEGKWLGPCKPGQKPDAFK